MSKRRRRSSSSTVLTLPFKIAGAIFGIFAWLLRRSIGRVFLILAFGAILDAWLVESVLGSLDTLSARVALIAFYCALLLIVVGVLMGIRQRRRFRAKTFGELLSLTPRQFEQTVGYLLHDLGYRDVRHIGGSGDLAADLKCRDRKGRSVVVQCKRHAPGISVGSQDMQAFIGMIAVHHQAERGIFVTTSRFTQPAVKLAGQHGIDLIDGTTLTAIVKQVQMPDSLQTA